MGETQMFNAYLKVEGVPGEATSGSSSELTFTALTDATSLHHADAKLYQSCANGVHDAEVRPTDPTFGSFDLV
jgi:hypothetical protein